MAHIYIYIYPTIYCRVGLPDTAQKLGLIAGCSQASEFSGERSRNISPLGASLLKGFYC